VLSDRRDHWIVLKKYLQGGDAVGTPRLDAAAQPLPGNRIAEVGGDRAGFRRREDLRGLRDIGAEFGLAGPVISAIICAERGRAPARSARMVLHMRDFMTTSRPAAGPLMLSPIGKMHYREN